MKIKTWKSHLKLDKLQKYVFGMGNCHQIPKLWTCFSIMNPWWRKSRNLSQCLHEIQCVYKTHHFSSIIWTCMKYFCDFFITLISTISSRIEELCGLGDLCPLPLDSGSRNGGSYIWMLDTSMLIVSVPIFLKCHFLREKEKPM